MDKLHIIKALGGNVMFENYALWQTAIVLFGVFALAGMHKAIGKLLNLLESHLERFQGKADVLLVVQTEQNEKLDIILRKLV